LSLSATLTGLCAAALLVSCGSGQAAAEQKSAAQVARAIEVLRQAPNPAKAAPLALLSKLPCTGQDVCQTRDTCRAAYALHVEALTLTAVAKQKLADDQPLEAAKLLNASDEKLKAADSKVTTCTELEGALRRRHKL
jgi:hypothetical protein